MTTLEFSYFLLLLYLISHSIVTTVIQSTISESSQFLHCTSKCFLLSNKITLFRLNILLYFHDKCHEFVDNFCLLSNSMLFYLIAY